MVTNIDPKMNDFRLPHLVKYDKDYYIELNEFFSKYITHLKSISNLKKKCIKRTQRNIDFLKECLEMYNNAKIGEARNCIKQIICNYIDNPFIIAKINKNYAFNGSAPPALQKKEYKNNKRVTEKYKKMNKYPLNFYKARVAINNLKRKEMLHIPFNKRGLISTQRFSIAGVPCLYLATTSLACWLEMEMPDPSLFQVASYDLPDDLKILNLCISQDNINGNSHGGIVDEKQMNRLCSFIEVFPLVYATSFQVLDNNRKFKSEYIISQLLMQVANELEIDGIAYLSKKMTDDLAYPQAVNLAIPMKSSKFPPYNENFLEMYWNDADKIKLSDPTRYSEFLEKNLNNKAHKLSFINKFYNKGFNSKISLGGDERNYTKTRFSQFDNFLAGQKHNEFK